MFKRKKINQIGTQTKGNHKARSFQHGRGALTPSPAGHVCGVR